MSEAVRGGRAMGKDGELRSWVCMCFLYEGVLCMERGNHPRGINGRKPKSLQRSAPHNERRLFLDTVPDRYETLYETLYGVAGERDRKGSIPCPTTRSGRTSPRTTENARHPSRATAHRRFSWGRRPWLPWKRSAPWSSCLPNRPRGNIIRRGCAAGIVSAGKLAFGVRGVGATEANSPQGLRRACRAVGSAAP